MPDLVHKFVGYNYPEQHKLRKRLTHSLSKDVLFSHLTSFKEHFGPMWAEFKQSVDVLASSISKHGDHSSPDFMQSIVNILTVRYTGVHAVPLPLLISMSDAVTT